MTSIRMRDLVVQKYGGSSVARPDLIVRVARRLIATRNEGRDLVVVVSAMGKTTNHLIRLAERVCGLTYDTAEARVSVLDLPDRPGVAARIFSALAEADINVDVIVLNRTRGGLTDLCFTLPRGDERKGLEILRELAAREGFGDVISETAIAKVSIVGAGMRSHPGVAAKMFAALAGAGVNIALISTSEIKVSCVIPEADLEKALPAVYVAFDMDSIPDRRLPS